MAFGVKEIVKDKRVWAVAGVGGVAGLVILMKGKSSGSGSTASDAAGYGVQTGGSVGGSYDSTSSDVANQLGQYQTGLQTALGQYSQAQQDQLNAYQKSLTDSLAGLKGSPSAPNIVTAKSWKAGTKYTADSVARRFGITVDQLQAANPGSNIKAGILKGVTINVPVTSVNAGQFGKG
jgi:LysM repeat protein